MGLEAREEKGMGVGEDSVRVEKGVERHQLSL